jgi:hypothetical protein
MLTETQQYMVKIAGGAVALVLWVLSVTNPPILALDQAAQVVLLAAAVTALGWGGVQGFTATRDASAYRSRFGR